MKKTSLLFTTIIAVVMAAVALTSSHGQDPDWKPPGSEEQAAVDAANGTIDKVYGELMGKLDDKQQKSLKETQRAWIKWRDAEADFVARLGGAIGGSAMRVDFANAQLKLIQERTKILRGYIEQAENQQSNGD